MAKRKGTCWMCGRPGPLTEEHAFPNWVRKIFALDGNEFSISDHRAGITERSETWTNISGEIVVRSVCDACNGGWMSGLERRCKPFLEPLILGSRRRLEPDAQAILALWAVKTSWAFQSMNPRTSTCSVDQRKTLATADAVPEGIRVSLGGFDEEDGNVLCCHWYIAGSTTEEAECLDISATTLVIGRSVFQILQLNDGAIPSGRPVRHSPPIINGFQELFPPTGEPIDWPRLPPLRRVDLDNFVKPPSFTTRIGANLPLL